MVKGVAICVLVGLVMAHLMVEPSEAMTCSDVVSSLGTCITYLTGADAKPVVSCCNGIERLKGMAVTTADKRMACNCIKQAASRFHNIKDSAVSSLPNQCGTPLSFPISTATNCNTIP